MTSVEVTGQHQPVLVEEVLTTLGVRRDGIYVDCTFGRGGHAQEILKHMGDEGRLLAMDRDPQAKAAAQELAADPRVTFCHESFAALAHFVESLGCMGKVNGVLFDLGISSPQLDQAERGFSFQGDGRLDMRMDTTTGMTAEQWLARVTEEDLADCLQRYGEERYARRIARAIIAVRRERAISTTRELAEIVVRAHPAWQRGQHPATRTFQAIRILINDELKQLKQGLVQALTVLAVGGRLLVISFHSLEDRIVKQFMRHESGRNPTRELPTVSHPARLRIIGKAIKPRPEEIRANPRARSAVLRSAEKLA